MCEDAALESNPFSLKVADLDFSIMCLARNQWCRGWTILMLKRHANELFELSDAELCGFSRDIGRASRALQRVFKPIKLNYAVFGNVCPHVHCHLVPRFVSDDPNVPLNMQEQQVLLQDAEYQRTILELQRALTNLRSARQVLSTAQAHV